MRKKKKPLVYRGSENVRSTFKPDAKLAARIAEQKSDRRKRMVQAYLVSFLPWGWQWMPLSKGYLTTIFMLLGFVLIPIFIIFELGVLFVISLAILVLQIPVSWFMIPKDSRFAAYLAQEKKEERRKVKAREWENNRKYGYLGE